MVGDDRWSSKIYNDVCLRIPFDFKFTTRTLMHMPRKGVLLITFSGKQNVTMFVSHNFSNIYVKIIDN